jgi:hypothetical protein
MCNPSKALMMSRYKYWSVNGCPDDTVHATRLALITAVSSMRFIATTPGISSVLSLNAELKLKHDNSEKAAWC